MVNHLIFLNELLDFSYNWLTTLSLPSVDIYFQKKNRLFTKLQIELGKKKQVLCTCNAMLGATVPEVPAKGNCPSFILLLQ